MKRLLAILLVILCTMSTSYAEGVVILSSPDVNNAPISGSPDDMKPDEPIDLGDRVYTVLEYKTQDYYISSGLMLNKISSGSEAEYLIIWMEVLNFSNKEQVFFKDADVVITYESERGPYQFGGFVRQAQGFYEYDSKRATDYNQDSLIAIQPLYKGYYMIGCAVPNFVIENPGELKMDITTGNTTLTYYVRK